MVETTLPDGLETSGRSNGETQVSLQEEKTGRIPQRGFGGVKSEFAPFHSKIECSRCVFPAYLRSALGQWPLQNIYHDNNRNLWLCECSRIIYTGVRKVF